MNWGFSDLSGLEKFFLICAVIGTILFLVRFVLQLIGSDSDVDTDIDVGNADVMHADADASFKLLTMQGLTAFFMMFGLVGFALLRGSRTNELVAVAGAVAAGMGTVWVLGRIFSSVRKLQSSGTFDNQQAIGSTGTVYLNIPAEGTGKVQVVVNGRLREYNAVAAAHEELRTGTPVRVVAVNGSILAVEKSS